MLLILRQLRCFESAFKLFKQLFDTLTSELILVVCKVFQLHVLFLDVQRRYFGNLV